MDSKDTAKKYQGQHPQRKGQAIEEEGKVIQLIVFSLGDEEFGTDIDQVREIIRAGTVTPIPDSPDFIKGVTNVRGEIAVVIDLKKRFFLRTKNVEERHIIMTEQEKSLFGLMVDEVTEVLRIPQEDIKTTPELVTGIDRMYINGVLTLEDRLIIMLDLSKVLSEEELAKLSEIHLRNRSTMETTTGRVEKEEKVETETQAEPVGIAN
jgi:purine-binding chemotaxis protein CheW